MAPNTDVEDNDEFVHRCVDDEHLDEIDWDSDPARIVEQLELSTGTNCFGQSIN